MTATLVLIRTPSGYESRRERPRLRARLAALWRERAGTFLDPMLVGNFVLMMAEAAPASPGN